MSILLLTDNLSAEADAVETLLTVRGIKYFRFNKNELARGDIGLSFDESGNGFLFTKSAGLVYLNTVHAVLYTSTSSTVIDVKDAAQRLFAENELHSFYRTLIEHLSHARWVNHPYHCLRANTKAVQLQLAKEIGFKVPRTKITNISEDVRMFIEDIGAEVVYKTISSSIMNEGSDSRFSSNHKIKMVPVLPVSKDDLLLLDTINKTGGIFQEKIEKEYEVRSIVVKDKVFSVKINSQKELDKLGASDSHFVPWNTDTVAPYTLPLEIETFCISLTKKLQLRMSSIDFIRTPGGEYIFLEINPETMWLWEEKTTNQPITETIVNTLSD